VNKKDEKGNLLVGQSAGMNKMLAGKKTRKLTRIMSWYQGCSYLFPDTKLIDDKKLSLYTLLSVISRPYLARVAPVGGVTMKQSYSVLSLITAISLLLCVIWLNPVFAAEAPTFVSLGQITAEELRVPGAMDLDESGNLYVADARGGLVHQFSPYGDLVQSFDLQTSGRGLAVTPDGTRLYVSRAESVVIVDALEGRVIGSLVGAEAGGPEFGAAGEIVLDAVGNVFVADTGKMLVKIYDDSGQYQNGFGGIGPNAGQFTQISGMALSPSGQLVVADSSVENGKVQVFDINADLSVSLSASYSKVAANFGLTPMNKPSGLDFDAQGRGYFLDFMTATVRVTDANFASLVEYGEAGYTVGLLDNIVAVAFDNANSRLFVACDSGRIEIFGVDGGQNPVRVNHAPTSPLPKSPVAGSDVASTSPTLVINNAIDEDGDALTYSVVITQDDVVVSQLSVAAEAGATTRVDVDVQLVENTAYSWAVRATDGEKFSGISEASFVVNAVEEAPSVPVLSAPANDESIDGAATLSWGESIDPDLNDNEISYLVEVALDETFTQIVAAELLTSTSMQLNSFTAYGDLNDGVNYFWRVSAQDDTPKASAPSDTGRFVYDTTVLTITANMPDAVVSFSGNHAYAGQKIGVAPVELRDFTPGTLSVVVERAGFERFVAQVSLVDGENVDLYAELVPAMVVEKLSRKDINGRSGLSVSGAAVPFVIDFDNDGDLDMLVGDGSGQVSLFANMQLSGRNRLSFDKSVSLGLPVMSQAVPFVADWNNDGRKDLIVGQADGSVKLFINVGQEEAPAFAAGVDVPTVNGALDAGNNAAPAVVDYNGDGVKDLLVGNASGQVLVFLNLETDAAPLLAAPTTALQVNGSVVPFFIDWDADGQKELMLSANGAVTVYAEVDGEYQAVQEFNDRRADYTGAFPINLGGSGKQMIAGQSDGTLIYLSGNNTEAVASFQNALQDKVDEIGGYVADEAPELLADVTVLSGLIEAGDFAAAALAAEALAGSLAAGDAQTATFELAALCN